MRLSRRVPAALTITTIAPIAKVRHRFDMLTCILLR
jgi:hypothetical protein